MRTLQKPNLNRLRKKALENGISSLFYTLISKRRCDEGSIKSFGSKLSGREKVKRSPGVGLKVKQRNA